MTKNGCRVCGDYLEAISKDHELSRKIENGYIFVEHNVDISGNEYLYQIMKEYSFPITYIFSPTGGLKAMALGNRINHVKETINLIERYPDSLVVENMSFKVAPLEYKKTISYCLQAYLQNKKILSGSAIESIDKSISICPYFYNLYLKTKILENTDLKTVVNSSERAVREGLVDEIDKFLYEELINELNYITGNRIQASIDTSLFVFKNKTIDLGKVKYKEECKFIFIAKNIGNKPVLINAVKASCNCMNIEWEKKPILPGEYAEIQIDYNTKNKGVFSKVLFVHSNLNKVIKLQIKGKIE